MKITRFLDSTGLASYGAEQPDGRAFASKAMYSVRTASPTRSPTLSNVSRLWFRRRYSV
jgi:hypothetical protein